MAASIAPPELVRAAAEAKTPEGAELFARSFYQDPRIRKIIGSVMLSSGLPFALRDDLFQETFFVVHNYATTERLTNAAGIYSLVYASAYNSARSIRNQEAKNGAGIAALPADDDSPIHEIVDESSIQDHGEAVDIIRARNKIAGILKKKQSDPMQFVPQVSPLEPEVRVRKPERRPQRQTERRLSPEQVELTQIISSLGYKHEEFAGDIGIGMSRLASYLYGRTTTVPAHIMARARQLKTQAAPVVERWKKAYGKPVSEIIAGWEQSLGLAPGAKGNDDILARILEVNPVTVYRWRKGDTTPQMHSIAKMDGRVQAELERRGRSDARPQRPRN